MQCTFLRSGLVYSLALVNVKYSFLLYQHGMVCACTLTSMLMQVDTIFLLAAIVYITQLLFYTWALEDQQAKKWPLLGYAMLPVLLLQHGDTPW